MKCYYFVSIYSKQMKLSFVYRLNNFRKMDKNENVIIKLKTSWKFQAASNIHPKMAAFSSFCIIGCIGRFIWLIFSNFANTRKILLLMYVIHASCNKSVKKASHTNVWFTINNPWKVVIRNFWHFQFYNIITFRQET